MQKTGIKLSMFTLLVYMAVCLLGHMSAYAAAETEWTQESYSKKLDLGGAVSVVELDIKATPAEIGPEGSATYLFYLSRQEHDGLSMLTASLEQNSTHSQLEVMPLGPLGDQQDTYQYAMNIPMKEKTDVSLSIKGVFLHQASPLPKELKQGDLQLLTWDGDAQPRTPYVTASATVFINSPDPILTFKAPVTSSQLGNAVQFGPFTDLQPYTADSEPVPQGHVHFAYSKPLVSYKKYQRHVEISHWGDNMATRDYIWLQNVGPRLKGCFSRSQNMINMHMNPLLEKTSQIQSIPLSLPGSAEGVYYVDATGNVSTSNLKASPKAAGTPRRLDIRPRYPVLGGWNYTFTVGWNERMSKSGIARFNPAKPWRTRIAVPFLISPKTASIENATLTISLPEGAQDIKVSLPFKVDNVHTSRYPSYLDTVGRPTISITRAKCSFMNAMPVFVEYTLPITTYLRKPFCVTLAVLLVFAASAFVSRQINAIPQSAK